MSRGHTKTQNHNKADLTLLPETLRLLQTAAPRANRRRLIDEALRLYLKRPGGTELRKRLREGAVGRAHRDRRIAEEWFALE